MNIASWLHKVSIGVLVAMLLVSPGAAGNSLAPHVPPETDRTPSGPQARIYLAAGDFDPIQTPVLPGLPARLETGAGDGTWLVQFDGPISAADKTRLEASGYEIVGYLPDFAFLVRPGQAAVPSRPGQTIPGVRWAGAYLPAYRISPSLLSDPVLTGRAGPVDLTVVTFRDVDPSSVAAQIEALGGAVLALSRTAWKGKLLVRVDSACIESIAQIAGVEWVEPAPRWQLFNNKAADVLGVRPVWDLHGLYGAGQIVAVADTGLDQGLSSPADLHDDFENGSGASRVLHIFELAGDGAASDVHSGHGTHVAGSVLGNGAQSGSTPSSHLYPATSFAGMAPEASLVFQAVENNATSNDLSGIPNDLNVLFDQAYAAGARIHTDSWGSQGSGIYDAASQDVDEFTWAHPDFTVLFANGNEGIDTDADGVVDLYSTGSPATAKNAISVGASENDRLGISSTWGQSWPTAFSADPIKSDLLSDNALGLAAFSSRGPTLDGRYKPDLVAPGTFIASTRSSLAAETGWLEIDQHYVYMGGTSMATPLVAGAAALVREYYTRTQHISPSAALIKATLINGATELYPGQYGAGPTQEITPTRPNAMEGWGRVSVENSVYPSSSLLLYVDQPTGLDTGGVHTYTYAVTDTARPLNVTLAWTDYPGTLAAAGGLVNDLDLNVRGPDGTTHYPDHASRRGPSQALYFDDGTPKYSYNLTAGQRAAVKFTPASYPVTLDRGVVYVYAPSYPTSFLLKVWDDDGPGGKPDTELFSTPVTARVEGWVAVAVTGVSVSSGSFYLGVEITTAGSPRPMTDQDSTGTQSWYYDGKKWSDWFAVIGYQEDLLMRAIVKGSDDSTPNDRVNSVESLHVATPAAGLYAVTVHGYNVPQGPQPYGLVVSGAVTQVVPPPQPPTGLAISGPAAGFVQTGNSFTATVSPLTATQPITYSWQATHQAAAGAHTGGLSDSVSFTWDTLGPQTITVTAMNISGTVTATHMITIAPVPVAFVTIGGPTAGISNTAYTFTADAGPAGATPPISYVWQATGRSPLTHPAGGLSDTVAFTWLITGTQVVTVTATQPSAGAGDSVTHTHAIWISALPEPIAGVDIAGPTEGQVNTAYTFTAAARPVTATQPITYAWQATGQPAVTHTHYLSDAATFRWDTAGTQVISVTATNAANGVTSTHTITLALAPVAFVTIGGPDSGDMLTAYAFTATVSPVTSTQPITYTWQAEGVSPAQWVTHTGGLSDTAVFTWTAPGVRTISVTAANLARAVTASHVITLAGSSTVPVAFVTISGPGEGRPGTGYTFMATVDPLAATPPITYVWRHEAGVPAVMHVGGPTDSVTLTWDTLGQQTIVVTAANAAGMVTGTRQFVVQSSVIYLPLILKHWPPLPYQPALSAISNADGDGAYTVSWTEQPSRLAITYTLQEATDAGFVTGVRKVCSPTDQSSCDVTGQMAGIYYYRVRGRNDYGYSQWSNTQAAVVIPPDAPTLYAISNADGNGDYTVVWSTAGRATAYVLQEDEDVNLSSPTLVYGPGPNTSFSVSGHQIGYYYYRVRADGPTGSSAWSSSQPVSIKPNDTSYSYQWGLPKVNALQAWSRSTGAGVVVAVVDTGADLDHPDLAGKLVAGYDFVNGDNSPQDDEGHGTHVSGIIAAATNNGRGVSGMSWEAQVMPIKALDYEGSGWTSDIASGIQWAVNNGAKVINLSLGSESSSATMLAATNYAYDRGRLVVAAAGNCGDQYYDLNGCSSLNPVIYPAANQNVLAVGSTTSGDTRSSFSEYGWFVDVTAPGSNIYSTLWDNTYDYESGTSMASPLVAGLVALVWARNPGMSNAQVAGVIASTAKDLGPAGRDDYYGYGRVDAGLAVAAALSIADFESQLSNLQSASDPTGATGVALADAPIRPGVVLARFKPGALSAGRQDVLDRYGAHIAGQIDGIGVLKLSVPAGQERAISAQLAAQPGVEFAEPDYRVGLIR